MSLMKYVVFLVSIFVNSLIFHLRNDYLSKFTGATPVTKIPLICLVDICILVISTNFCTLEIRILLTLKKISKCFSIYYCTQLDLILT